MAQDQPRSSRLKIGLLTAWSSRRGGGVFEAVVSHALALKAYSAFEPIVFAPDDRFTADDRKRFGDVALCTAPRAGPEFFGYARGLLEQIIAADVDVLHLHGIWQYASLCGAQWAERSKRPYVISPHGMLDPWITGRGRWKKALARFGYERRSWRDASLFHALTAVEEADIARNVGSVRLNPRIEIVPNSIPIAAEPPHKTASPMMLFIGRIHPKKNLDALIDAWIAAKAAAAGFRLLIAGWGEERHVAALKAKLKEAGDPSIAFLGPVYGADKQRLLENARFFLLPSLSEGLPMAVLEAWAIGIPCIMSAACNLPEGFEKGAAFESGTAVPSITAALRRGLELSNRQWGDMSAAAHRLALARFSPEVVATQWVSVYNGLLAH